MVKKVMVALFVLSMVVSANAGLTIMVRGEDGLWAEYADSKLTITPSTEIEVGIIDDGLTPVGTVGFGLALGLGSLSDNVVVFQDGVTAFLADDAVTAERLGLQNMFISMTLDQPNEEGLLVSDIFHCEGEGDVTLALIDYETGLILDTQVIHQVPEPATLALLSLGGLLLRRRQ